MRTITCVLAIVAIVAVTLLMFRREEDREGFASWGEEGGNFEQKEGLDVFDDFYSGIYDQLVYNQGKNAYEIQEIIKMTQITPESVVLDVGCGTGHHVGELSKTVRKVVGLDISPSMIARARDMYPDAQFVVGDAQDGLNFAPDTYTHVLCLYFTIYYLPDRRAFFRNAFQTLVGGGHLLLHLVHREQFDPILPPGNPFLLVSIQSYAKERITQTRVTFDDLDYQANFALDKPRNTAQFKEQFRDRATGRVRRQTHHLHMPAQRAILAEAQEEGFILAAKIDLTRAQYEYQYVFVLQKPE